MDGVVVVVVGVVVVSSSSSCTHCLDAGTSICVECAEVLDSVDVVYIYICGILAVDGRAKNKDKAQSQLSGTLRNSQHKNEDMVSMMSVDEMPIKSYTPPSKGTRRQRKRAGIMNYGNRRKATEMEKMPRPEGHRKRVHWEVNLKGIEREFTGR
jgi:hypothetical protein